jgi:heterodisulfide reductase subunit A-like polyferredoxin
MDASKIQSVIFALADGAAILFPVAAVEIKLIEAVIRAAEGTGVAPLPVDVSQALAQTAGAAARAASAVEQSRHPKTQESPVQPATAKPDGEILKSTVT